MNQSPDSPSRGTAEVAAEPEAAAAGTPLGEITDDLARRGRDGQFQALEGGVLRCLTCDHRFAAADAPADEMTRLEGASDPADLAIVIPLQCPRCGRRRRAHRQLRARGHRRRGRRPHGDAACHSSFTVGVGRMTDIHPAPTRSRAAPAIRPCPTLAFGHRGPVAGGVPDRSRRRAVLGRRR